MKESRLARKTTKPAAIATHHANAAAAWIALHVASRLLRGRGSPGMSVVRHRPSFAYEIPAPARKQDRKTHPILHAGSELFNLFPSKFPLFAKKTGREYACCSLARKGAPCRKRKSSSTRDRMGRRRKSGIAVAQGAASRRTDHAGAAGLPIGPRFPDARLRGAASPGPASLLEMLLPGSSPASWCPGRRDRASSAPTRGRSS